MASADPPAPGESGASGTTKKMGSSSLWVPGPALSLLLLLFLLLPPPLLSTGSFLHRLPAWRPFHQGTRHYRSKIEKPKTCEGAFDLYLIVDTSDNANSIWKDIYKFVDDLVKRFPNSKMRMSLITYSTQSDTIMNLTSDRSKIHNSLEKIQNIVPTGAANMHEGFKKANEQIEKAIYGGSNAPSLIIGLTAGPLTPRTFEETESEAEKARERGAKVYSVGVKDYKNDQLKDIVERNDQFYGVNSGFESLEDIVNMLVVNSCQKELDRPQQPEKPQLSGPNSTGFSVTFSLFSSLQRRCLNFARLRPPCMKYPCTPKICLLPCTPKICFPPSQECFPISNCYSCCQCPSRKCSRLPSRMLPLMAPSSRALCGTTLSLPPP
ncbi:anthrax toxin receptor-like [Panthera uncia]|uniref:anthrax toxin receptor-like n=1 Tax=Panthera uncia TaxID=29064 RepID=UPI0020FFA629|nr:anthrax toxin receptor-like [Panthera uncia]